MRLTQTMPTRTATTIQSRRSSSWRSLPKTKIRLLVPLGGPVSRTSCVSRTAAPPSLAGRTKQPASSSCVLVLHRDGRPDGARALHVTRELHEVRVRHDSIRNVDRKIVGRIARPRLGYERQIPRSVECCG